MTAVYGKRYPLERCLISLPLTSVSFTCSQIFAICSSRFSFPCTFFRRYMNFRYSCTVYLASRLEEETLTVTQTQRGVQVSFALPKDGVALIRIR